MDSYRVSTVDVPECPIASGARGPRQQRCASCIVMKNDGFCTTKCRRFLLSTCDYNLFAKVKEPRRGTRYNTRDELTSVIGRSIRNINKYGHADGVRRLTNIWQKVINKGGDYIEGI